MKSRNLILFGLCSIIFLNSNSFAQSEQNLGNVSNNAKRLTMPECIELAQKKSSQSRIIKKDNKKRIMAHKSFRADYYPQFTLNAELPGLQRAINPVIQNDGTTLYMQQKSYSSSGALSINQKIPLTGGEISLSSGINRIDIFGSQNQFFWRSSPVQISLSQPLFQFNSIRINIRYHQTGYIVHICSNLFNILN